MAPGVNLNPDHDNHDQARAETELPLPPAELATFLTDSERLFRLNPHLEIERWEARLGKYRSDSATRRLPRFLIGHPVLSVQQAAKGLGISVPAANAAINNLLNAGIVNLVDERQWGRVFQAREILERLDRPSG